jgi:hypothetical protein
VDDARLTTVMGTARDVLATVGPDDGAGVLVDMYGWDATVQALAVLPGGTARAAFGRAWSLLLADEEGEGERRHPLG